MIVGRKSGARNHNSREKIRSPKGQRRQLFQPLPCRVEVFDEAFQEFKGVRASFGFQGCLRVLTLRPLGNLRVQKVI